MCSLGLSHEGNLKDFSSTFNIHTRHTFTAFISPSPPLDNIRVMVIVWRLRGNIIRTALCWIVWHNVHSPQHTYMSSSYRSSRLGLSHWDPYAVHRGGCLELYYCNMVEWFWWDSGLNLTTNWFPSVLWHCWFGHVACKNRPWNDLLCVKWDVKPYTLTHSLMFVLSLLCRTIHLTCWKMFTSWSKLLGVDWMYFLLWGSSSFVVLYLAEDLVRLLFSVCGIWVA